MDAISQTQAPGAKAPAAAAQQPDAQSALSSDFETFLKMLTAQMQNQDPLNPIESSDYAVQLATFSGVEQQVQTNDLLRSLGAGGDVGGLARHASWIGMDARIEGPVSFDGATPVELHYDLPPGAAAAELVVSGPAGQELHRVPVTEPGPMSWSGTSPGGDTLLAGSYSLALESAAADGTVQSLPVSSYARVTEVRAGENGPVAVMGDGTTVPAAQVKALREPG